MKFILLSSACPGIGAYTLFFFLLVATLYGTAGSRVMQEGSSLDFGLGTQFPRNAVG